MTSVQSFGERTIAFFDFGRYFNHFHTMDAQQEIQMQSETHSSLLKDAPVERKRRKMQRSDAALLLRKRYWVCVLVNIGIMFTMLLKSNLSVALVEMTTDKKIQMNNETIIKKAEFDWDSKIKGFILSVHSIGYICGPIGGILCLKWGAVPTFGVAIAATGLLSALTPFLIRVNLFVYLAARLLEGLFESFTPPCNLVIMALWALPHERARLSTAGMAGGPIGIAISYPLCGFLIKRYGWEYMFGICGGMSLIWSIIWFMLVSNDPTRDRLMTQEERNRFKMNVPEYLVKKKKTDIPWKAIAGSKPVWAYLNEFFSFYWVQSFVNYCLPLYVKDLYNVGIENIGLISGIPAIANVVGLAAAAYLCDYMRNNTALSKPFLHRIFIAIGQISFIINLTYCGLWADFQQSLICLSLAKFMGASAQVSYRVLAIDMFGEFTGLIRGFGVSATSLAYFLNPIVMGFMVADHSRSSWNLYFLFLSIFNVWSLVIYYLYGSGELQEWATSSIENRVNNDKSTDEKLESR